MPRYDKLLTEKSNQNAYMNKVTQIAVSQCQLSYLNLKQMHLVSVNIEKVDTR